MRTPCFVAVAMLLSACASAPQPMPTRMAAPAAWSVPAASTTQVTPAEESEEENVTWWTDLGDRQLDAWVQQAWRDSAEVPVLVARLELARAAGAIADADRRPRLDIGAAATRERVPRSVLRDGQGSEAVVPPFRQSRWGAQIEGRYEVDLLGRLALGQRTAVAGVAASQADLLGLRRWLTSEVVQAYAELRRAEHDATAALAQQALLAQIQQAERERLAAGQIAREPLRQAERQLADKREEQIEFEQKRQFALVRLAQLLGRAPAELLIGRSPEWLPQRSLSGALEPGLPAAVITRRADVEAAWQRVQAAAATAERTRLERYPTLTLTGNAGFASTALRRWLQGDALAWLAQAALQAPLLDGGRQIGRTREAAAAMQEAYALYRKQVLQALSESETALAALQFADERVSVAHAELARRQDDLASTQAARAAGAASRPVVLLSELARMQASTALQKRRHELLLAWAEAQRAFGR